MRKRLDRGFSSYKCECSYLLRLKSRIIVLKKSVQGMICLDINSCNFFILNLHKLGWAKSFWCLCISHSLKPKH